MCDGPLCLACEGNAARCTLCAPGTYALPTGACAPCQLPTCAQCEVCDNTSDDCTDGLRCTEPCRDANCVECPGTGQTCAQCAAGYLLHAGACMSVAPALLCGPGCWDCDEETGKCNYCGDGSYVDAAGECRPCDIARCAYCVSCASEDLPEGTVGCGAGVDRVCTPDGSCLDPHCLSCPGGSTGGSSTCQRCEAGFLPDAYGSCMPLTLCKPGCATCALSKDKQPSCTACVPGFHLAPDADAGGTSDVMGCKPCPPGCAQCEPCAACADGARCIKPCADAVNCQACPGGDASVCASCGNGLMPTPGGKCVVSTPAAGKACVAIGNCTACALKEPATCVACAPGHLLAANNTCQPCNVERFSDCERCIGGDDCIDGRRGVTECEEMGCLDCAGDARVCRRCQDNAEFWAGRCFFSGLPACKDCLAGYYTSALADCIPCNLPSCAHCRPCSRSALDADQQHLCVLDGSGPGQGRICVATPIANISMTAE